MFENIFRFSLFYGFFTIIGKNRGLILSLKIFPVRNELFFRKEKCCDGKAKVALFNRSSK